MSLVAWNPGLKVAANGTESGNRKRGLPSGFCRDQNRKTEGAEVSKLAGFALQSESEVPAKTATKNRHEMSKNKTKKGTSAMGQTRQALNCFIGDTCERYGERDGQTTTLLMRYRNKAPPLDVITPGCVCGSL